MGRWINEGHVIDDHGSPGPTITTSDVYEWAPGGFFLLHTAFGRIGAFDVGSIESIGYNETSDDYTSHFSNSQGNDYHSYQSHPASTNWHLPRPVRVDTHPTC